MSAIAYEAFPSARIVVEAAEYARSRTVWLAARKQGLGASEAAAVLGLDTWSSPLDVYLEKVSPQVGDDTPVSEAAEWGSAIEAVVARKVSTRHRDLGKVTPSPGLLAHRDHPWLLATVDRLLAPRGDNPWALLEIKTTDGRFKPDWADGPPPRVQVQVQQQLLVTGLPVAYVAVLFGGREMPAPFEVRADPAVHGLILEHAGRFWREHVEARVPPEPRIGDDAALATLYPGDDALDAAVASEELEELFQMRRLYKAQLERDQANLDECDLAIKAAMADHTSLIAGDGRVLATWKPSTSNRLDTKRFKADHPDLAAAYTTTSTTRRFLVKENPHD